MKHSTTQGIETTIGIDLGDRYSHFCVLDPDGTVVEASRVPSKPREFRQRFGKMPPARIALEVGTHSPWVQRLLQEYGHEVLVANARKLRMIFQAVTKTDQLDAEKLARVARMDPALLAPISHRGEQGQGDLALLRSRDALVRTRTSLINHVRGAVKSFGSRLRGCAARNFHTAALEKLPDALRPALAPVLEALTHVTEQVAAIDRQLTALIDTRYPEASHLQQVPGVGPLTALRFVLTIEDPARFPRSRKVGAFLGLQPRRKQSGTRDPQLGISKAGDPALRRLLVCCAHYILGRFGPDCDLRRHGLALANRGGTAGKKRAAVAVARKLAVLLHRLWSTGEMYDPLYNSEPRRAPIRESA